MRNAVLIAIISGVLSGGGTWMWSMSQIVYKSDLETFRIEVSQAMNRETNHIRELLDSRIERLLSIAQSIDKRLERLESKE